MGTSYNSLMQSTYFHTAFNSAIFDGPLRIYFAQLHESLALKIYFFLTKQHAEKIQLAKELSKNLGCHCLIMLYPSDESFKIAKASDQGPVNFFKGHLGADSIIGLRVQKEDFEDSTLLTLFTEILLDWEHVERSSDPESFANF